MHGERGWALLGGGIAGAALLVPTCIALCWPGQVARARRCAWPHGSTHAARYEPATWLPPGTRVRQDGRTIGYVAVVLEEGRALLRLAEPLPATTTLRCVDAPRGLAWAVEEIVTPELLGQAAELAARTRLRDSLLAMLSRCEARFEARFPAVYQRHRGAIEGELGRLWRERLSSQAEAIARDHVVPHLSRAVPLGQVAREVASGTYEEMGLRDTASAVMGDEGAQERLKHEVGRQLATSPALRDGLRDGASAAWADPALRAELERSMRALVEDPALRTSAGGAVLEAFEQLLPELDDELRLELSALEQRGLALDGIVLGLALDSRGGLRPALMQVLRRELLRKDRHVLEAR